MLLLASIDASRLGRSLGLSLWATVLEVAEQEGADRFLVKSGRKRETLETIRNITKDANPTDSAKPLHPHMEDLIGAGPEVMEINVYSESGWVAGISDWGDNISILSSTQQWEKLRELIESLDPIPPYDVAEVDTRPPIPR